MKHVVTCGHFDPLNAVHIQHLQKVKALGDFLTVIINNDHQVTAKKGRPLINQEDRAFIVEALKCVDQTIISSDRDLTCCKTLEMINPHIFVKNKNVSENCPEIEVCKKLNIKFIDSV